LSIDPAGRAATGGLAATVQRLLRGLAEIGLTRLELARLELEAELERRLQQLLRAAIGLLLGALALAMGALWCVLRAAPEDRATWAAAWALGFGVAGALVAWGGRRRMRRRGPVLSLRGLPEARPGRRRNG